MSAAKTRTGTAVIEHGITAKEWLKAGRSPLSDDRKRPAAPPMSPMSPRQSVIKEAIIRWLETEL